MLHLFHKILTPNPIHSRLFCTMSTPQKGFNAVHEKMTGFHNQYRSQFAAIKKVIPSDSPKIKLQESASLTSDSEIENFRKLCSAFIKDVDTHHQIEGNLSPLFKNMTVRIICFSSSWNSHVRI